MDGEKSGQMVREGCNVFFIQRVFGAIFFLYIMLFWMQGFFVCNILFNAIVFSDMGTGKKVSQNYLLKMFSLSCRNFGALFKYTEYLRVESNFWETGVNVREAW